MGVTPVRAIFVYPPKAEVLDFAGPLQVLGECNGLGGKRYDILHCASSASVTTAQGLRLDSLAPLPEPRASDVIFVPGYPVMECGIPRGLARWLKQADRAGARILAICTGAFILGAAGLLDGRRCTTHWRRTDLLQREFPKAHVLTARLFVEDGRVTTSAGVASGIDMTLDFIGREHGAKLAAQVAREIVVYIRRDGTQKQQSVFTEYREHLEPGVHAVQDWLSGNPEARSSLRDLARIANMSERNLTRTFARATGISIGDYRTRLRLERARALLADPHMTIESAAADAGFADARQLRRLWKQAYGRPPSAAR